MTDLARRLRLLVTNTDPESDAALLDRFVANRDGMAFAALVARHGPMVLAVCRRVLNHRQDAEDAFQATFLVLARRAEAVRPRAMVGNWLYGVAHRTAQAARRGALARRAREAKAAIRSTDAVPDDTGLAPDLREALDRELSALPDVYRAALVACDLEGLSRRDAAVRLGWSEGTLSSRLTRARSLLARRLSRFGLAVPAGGLAVVAGPAVASTLVEPTIRLATLVAAGEAVVAAPVAILMEGTMRAMFVAKCKALAAVVVVGCAVAMTSVAGWRADAVVAADPPKASATPKVADAPKPPKPVVDPDKERIAELERERDLLLKQVLDLKVRLDRLEVEHRATRDAAAKAAAAADIRPDVLFPDSTGPTTPRPKTADAPMVGNKPAPRALEVPPPLPAGPHPSEPRIPVPVPTSSYPPPNTPAHRPPDVTVPGASPSKTAPVDLPPPRGVTVPTEQSPNQPKPAAKASVRVYPVADLAGDEKEGEALTKVLRATVSPKSWADDAGVEYLPGRKVLVVRQTAQGHDEVEELLRALQSQAAPGKKAPSR